MVKYRPITTIIIEVLLLVLCSFSFFLNWLSFSKLKKGKKKPLLSITNTSVLNKVSVVIAIKNEARYIGKTIRNLESTTVDKSRVQIILVDCGGKDNSIDVAKVSGAYKTRRDDNIRLGFDRIYSSQSNQSAIFSWSRVFLQQRSRYCRWRPASFSPCRLFGPSGLWWDAATGTLFPQGAHDGVQILFRLSCRFCRLLLVCEGSVHRAYLPKLDVHRL